MKIMTIDEIVRLKGRGLVLHGFVQQGAMSSLRIDEPVTIRRDDEPIATTTISNVGKVKVDRAEVEKRGGWRKDVLVAWQAEDDCPKVGDELWVERADSPLPDRSAAWDGDSERRDQESIDAAVGATMGHEFAIRAQQFKFCHVVVLFEAKSFVDRCRFDDGAKRSIRGDLSDAEEVILVSYQTSPQDPEPLAGGGETFDFVLHPETLAILHTSTGKWRS